MLEANTRTLKAGYNYGETTEALPVHYRVPPAAIKPGTYRKITGNEALAMGLVAAATLANVPLVYASYPITPASDILHHLAEMKRFGVRTIQAEDEIAAIGMAIGAAFGGALGVTATSGPGICLKSEAIGLAVMTELPLVIIDVQRGGPSTGLPTKTEQADLLQAMFGRNGECPVAIVAPCSPADCFAMIFEAVRLAVGFMTPVLFLSDGYLANGAEPWLHPTSRTNCRRSRSSIRSSPAANGNGERSLPAVPARRAAGPPLGDPRHAGPGAPHRRPGKGGRHRQRQLRPGQPRAHGPDAGAENRQHRQRDSRAGGERPERRRPAGDRLGRHVRLHRHRRAARQRKGRKVAHAHLRYLNPMPRNTGDVLKRYKKVLVPELNGGQLSVLLRAEFLVDAVGLNKVQGRPFLVSEIEQKIEQMLQSIYSDTVITVRLPGARRRQSLIR